VCFADESSTNILVSGSDDGYVKIWDRRSLSGGTPSGVLVGATEGITYTSPKGDGRYVVVNSKDQAARLYDLRKMKNWSEFEGENDAVTRYGRNGFDCESVSCDIQIGLNGQTGARGIPLHSAWRIRRTAR
jgi:WD repeat-containing protein 23